LLVSVLHFYSGQPLQNFSGVDNIANGTGFLGLFGVGGAARVIGFMDHIEKLHPQEPHWYLQAIGTDPAKQGKGCGGVLIRRQLANADTAALSSLSGIQQGIKHPNLRQLRLRGHRRDPAAQEYAGQCLTSGGRCVSLILSIEMRILPPHQSAARNSNGEKSKA
jgi:GNAT superfamily N-acetyltransferase